MSADIDSHLFENNLNVIRVRLEVESEIGINLEK